uniref:Glucan endo-1,3-beta-D-glucosidase n=1 Tax=Oryza rufipogon TaxID=4529 RepID=A0A0E0N7K6_ORYRU
MGGAHGVCYGVVGNNLPSRSEVVQLYKSKGISAMRIYYPDQEALAALRGSGIAVIVDVGDKGAVANLANNPSAAADWVRNNVQAYWPSVFIRYIAVGNELGPGDMGTILPAMQNLYNALVSAGLSNSIKVSTAVKMDVITNSFPPSHGVFRPDLQRFIVPIAQFLANTMSPLLVNVYPYFAYRDNPRDIPLNYATFQPGTTLFEQMGAYPRPAVQSIGVCYGMVGNDLPSRSEVVQMYVSLGINRMRIYNPDREALDALRNSGIDLILDAGGFDTVSYLAASSSNAASWVHDNISPYYPAVNIKYIAVGNEVVGGTTESILPAMRNVNSALAAAGIGGIKVSTAVKSDVIANSYPPSAGVFAYPYMNGIAQYLASTGAPLLANVYPYFAYAGNPREISLNYATFQPGTTVRDDGNGLTYTNLFDAMVDCIYAALEKADAGNVRVVVSESGWPSAEGIGASMDNARAYNQGLIDHVGRGTPKRPGQMEAYIFAMFNENQKTGAATERHFGLFYPNKSPVYQIAFSN